MEPTVADTIRELTREHLEQHDGLLLGQCISAVGWIQGTVPAVTKGLVELPMNDVSGPGIAIGTALVGRRPILVVRFQNFMWLGASPIANYAAKAREIWGTSCPIFIRAIADEGHGAGPVHSGCFHSLFMHMPGMTVAAPMTPKEYAAVWEVFMDVDEPFFVSEHRRSYPNTEEMPDRGHPDAVITIFAMSAARFSAMEAVSSLEGMGVHCNLVNIMWLKPFAPSPWMVDPLKASGRGLVVDSGYEIAGAARSIAYELTQATGVPVRALGLQDRTSGVAPDLEVVTPSADRIVEVVRGML